MLRRMMAFLLALLPVLLVAGVASAHVTVVPKQSAVNGFERYTVRVPTEKAVPTTKVRVELPEGSTFSSVLPQPGWTFATEKDTTGKVVALVWSGGEIKQGEFFEFGISVRNPKTAGVVTWKAYQTYADGSVVAWAGPAGADQPAPTVTLVEAPAEAGGHGAAAPAPAPSPAPTAPAAGTNLGAWLGGAALLVSLVALVLAIRKR
jgi:uncharacterized protein YcnI